MITSHYPGIFLFFNLFLTLITRHLAYFILHGKSCQRSRSKEIRTNVSWEPEGRYQYSKMFRWAPEGRYRCTMSMAIAPFRFSAEHLWIVITPFWLETKTRNNVILSYLFCHLTLLSFLHLSILHQSASSWRSASPPSSGRRRFRTRWPSRPCATRSTCRTYRPTGRSADTCPARAPSTCTRPTSTWARPWGTSSSLSAGRGSPSSMTTSEVRSPDFNVDHVFIITCL